ncbi:MAG TPA: cobalamin biosynthesis protein [Oscillatoriales bacterium UBA8482]|nr:MAG: cobalamin biosynthesis protein [Oscillatoriales cyanobacterium CG2_30_40_61]HBW58095.1 cobalamin biosynthesis protein [Oscillatoriales bacterium UBA8482]
MTDFNSLIILLIAAVADYLIGDPQNWLHPVQVMGWVITYYTQIFFKYFHQPIILRVAGVFLTLIVVWGSALTVALIRDGIQTLVIRFSGPEILTIAVESILLASCFAGRSLRDSAEDVLYWIDQGDLVTARQRLSRYVGRDTETLSESEILRAVLETVTENATDGVMAPLFYALIGAVLPGVGSVPLTFAYKAASTLDSMVGYREAPYGDIGWFSAKLEDILTWLPCRLTVITIAILSGKPGYVLTICQRDAVFDPSPNAGWSECAYAAALGVQLGGENSYRGVIKHKPFLGDPQQPITSTTIKKALQLTRYSFLITLGLFTGGFILFNWGN